MELHHHTQELSDVENAQPLSGQTVADTELPPEFESPADSAASLLVAEPSAAFDNDDQDWLRVMLGPSLHGNPRIGKPIHWLEDNVLANNGDALLLVGQLLVFRFASSDRKPTLLKDVGEAFYRCFPKTLDARDPFEEELVDWLRQHCEEAGLPNSIELVHPGERFDATRHSPLERGGVEVAEVLGWVVLRDGGRVFSKASVQTR